jgi:7-carboxy-7-deazaguanine synthase (Cx14CxxC type)
MTYSVKEIFYTLQGEGLRAGRPAVFCRFTGCNLWSGREEDRSSAVCQFCDTDFIGTDGTLGNKFKNALALAECISSLWPTDQDNRYVVLTGGEPMLQEDDALVDALHAYSFEVAIETNGTIAVPKGIDWVCVSPKAGATWVQKSGDELKLVYPQPDLQPDAITNTNFKYYLLQPMDGLMQKQHTKDAIAYCQNHTKWRLSVQTHKILEIR